MLICTKINQSSFSSKWIFLVILLSTWALISLNFIFTLPQLDFFTHDFEGHVHYTKLIYELKKLPHPNQGWQTYQPPLYYIINQLFGVYTKYNIVLLIFSIGILLCGAFILRAIPFKKTVIILLPLVLGILMIIPYLRFHNFHHTGKYLVKNIESEAWPYWNIRQQVGFARFFFIPPAITNGEYTYPYAFDDKYGLLYNWTKRTYLSSIISTSLFGEFNYSRKAPGADAWAWITLWIYVALLANIAYVCRSVRLMSWFLILTLFTHGLFIRFFFPFFVLNANYRFFAWITMPLAVLLAVEFNRCFIDKNKKYLMLATLLIIGSLAHIIFINVLNHELSLFLKINATVK